MFLQNFCLQYKKMGQFCFLVLLTLCVLILFCSGVCRAKIRSVMLATVKTAGHCKTHTKSWFYSDFQMIRLDEVNRYVVREKSLCLVDLISQGCGEGQSYKLEKWPITYPVLDLYCLTELFAYEVCSSSESHREEIFKITRYWDFVFMLGFVVWVFRSKILWLQA